jgi:hypothetical protein
LEKFYKLHPKFDELRVTKKRQTNFLMWEDAVEIGIDRPIAVLLQNDIRTVNHHMGTVA